MLTTPATIDTRPTRDWFVRNVQQSWQEHLVPLGPFRRYLELGVFEGESLLWFAEHLLAAGGLAIGVDPYNGDLGVAVDPAAGWPERIAQAALKSAERCKAFNRTQAGEMASRKRCKLVRQESREFLAAAMVLREEFDCIYVDGVHFAPEALTDIVCAWCLLDAGGVLLIDDIHMQAGRRRGPQAREAWLAFFNCYRGRFRLLYETQFQAAVVKL